ncbi:MAG TPA: hypothetical protein VMZ49_12175 [Patescibacteria group bacterium]|nr:hypothetical protein [Patescibacteria group bacterium]
MKTKKFNLQWQSVLIGMALCLVLVVFLAGKAQTNPVDGTQRVLQRPANVNDVWEKTAVLEANTIALNERLIRIEQKIDLLQKTVHNGFNVVDRTLANKK